MSTSIGNPLVTYLQMNHGFTSEDTWTLNITDIGQQKTPYYYIGCHYFKAGVVCLQYDKTI
jgi:hypothetical protein